MGNPRVSIVIPAYNAEAFIHTAIGSALGQTVRDVEVVVVDDGSTDGTIDAVKRMAAEDERVVLVEHGENRKRLEARRTGIEHASGEFVLFLDSDDELLPDAAERMLAEQKGVYDIVQCSFEMRYIDYVSEGDRWFNHAFNQAPSLSVTGDEITHLVFLKRRTTWSLCGKLMRTSILKHAMTYIPESSLTQAEDACIFFIVSCLAETYRGIGDYEGYIYNIDLGGSDARWNSMDLSQFSYSCRYVDAMDHIRSFLEETGRMAVLEADYLNVRREHARSVAGKLLSCVKSELRSAAFDEFVNAWPVDEAVTGLSEIGWDNPADAVEAVSQAESLMCAPREIRTVAAYHYCMQVGGEERVTAELLNVWHDMGLRVVLFADEPREACLFDVPDDLIWITLPEAATMSSGEYAERASLIVNAIEEYHIDAVIYQQWWNSLLAWDLLCVKASGAQLCVFYHSIFMAMFYEANVRDFDQSRLLRYADGLIVLSDADKRFFGMLNPQVWKTNNPATILPGEQVCSSLDSGNIVWVGRLSRADKQPQEAIEIMARVVAHHPEAALTLVGPAPTNRELASLKALVRKLGIEPNVEFTGAVSDIAPYYRRASVHLLTSRIEGWCLVLAESKACGVPCVMYELDYLPLAQDHRGIIAVEQGDRDAAARAIVKLLDDDAYREEMGRDAFDHAVEMAQFDFKAFWSGVFDDLSKGSPSREGFEFDDMQWSMLVRSFKESVNKAVDQSVPSYAKRKGLKFARNIWHRLRS